MNTEAEMNSTQQRAGAWIGTVNNPTPEDRVALRTQQRWMRSCKGQDEVGESGTPHIQFLVCTDWIRMSSLKRWLPRAHFEPCRGTRHVANASTYVHKAETAVAGTQFNFTYRGERDVISTNKVLVSLYRLSLEYTTQQTQQIEYGFPADRVFTPEEWHVARDTAKAKPENMFYVVMGQYLAENPDHVNLFGNRIIKELWLHCKSTIVAWHLKDVADEMYNEDDSTPATGLV